MMYGSFQMSRSHALGRSLLAPRTLTKAELQATTERDFAVAARYVVSHRHELPLTLSTAQAINRLLTAGTVPEHMRGQAAYRADPARLYAWLASSEAVALGQRDPVALAERVHDEVSRLDAFPDGNGRTARLLADLVLLQHGQAPALYQSLEDYF